MTTFSVIALVPTPTELKSLRFDFNTIQAAEQLAQLIQGAIKSIYGDINAFVSIIEDN